MTQGSLNLEAGSFRLEGLSRINVVLGKNGCGKSSLLKGCETTISGDEIGRKKYITPERGGVLNYEPGIELNLTNNPTWMADSRRVNRFEQFRQQSVAQFRRLEITSLRQSESKGEVANFQPQIDLLNTLLDNIELRRDELTFKVFSKQSGDQLDTTAISSGESELISLGIELLMFAHEREPGKTNLLFLDEPDVHLHPDLQTRLAGYLTKLVDEHDFRVVLATHSTAILGALADYSGATVAFMRSGDKELCFEAISDVHRRILPVFGAHPLSNVFNHAPALIVEGDDDVRVWQQAVRTANGKLRAYPVPCDSVSTMGVYEQEVARIMGCVYDDARAWSLRDGDGSTEELDDLAPIVRMRLACRASENLILCDEVLDSVGLSWPEVVTMMNGWIDANPDHPRLVEMQAFQKEGYDRKGHDLKELRMLLVGAILSSSKPWEVLVGQVIGRYIRPSSDVPATDGSLADFLGPKTVGNLCRAS